MTQPSDVTGLPEPVGARLRELVASLRAGDSSANGTPTDDPSKLSYEEWKKRFDAWINRPRPPGPAFVDDSRESIYEGCGE